MQPLDDNAWDAKLAELDGSFLQSSAWAAFQESRGNRTHLLHGEGWACLLFEQQSKLKRYLIAPYGPALADADKLTMALEAIKTHTNSLGFQWARIEPTLGLSIDTELDGAVAAVKTLPAPKQVNPRHTRIIDVAPDEQTILTSISSNTRRLIRQSADNSPLTYRSSTDPQDMQLFLDMMHAVSERNQVNFHSDSYFLNQAEALMPSGKMRLELALNDGKPIAAIVMHDFNGVATYTYAASLPEARDLEASALLMWHGAIVNSKRLGMTRLDLFGVAPEDAPSSHPWHGFSSFKRKFGGTVVKRGPTLDLPVSARYYPYRAALKAKRLL